MCCYILVSGCLFTIWPGTTDEDWTFRLNVTHLQCFLNVFFVDQWALPLWSYSSISLKISSRHVKLKYVQKSAWDNSISLICFSHNQIFNEHRETFHFEQTKTAFMSDSVKLKHSTVGTGTFLNGGGLKLFKVSIFTVNVRKRFSLWPLSCFPMSLYIFLLIYIVIFPPWSILYTWHLLHVCRSRERYPSSVALPEVFSFLLPLKGEFFPSPNRVSKERGCRMLRRV